MQYHSVKLAMLVAALLLGAHSSNAHAGPVQPVAASAHTATPLVQQARGNCADRRPARDWRRDDRHYDRAPRHRREGGWHPGYEPCDPAPRTFHRRDRYKDDWRDDFHDRRHSYRERREADVRDNRHDRTRRVESYCGSLCWYRRLKSGYCGHGCDYYQYRKH